MAVKVAVGTSQDHDPVAAFAAASDRARESLGAVCDLAVLFAAAPHLGHAKGILSVVHERLGPHHLIGCGAGGVLGAGRELETGPGAVVWALAAPEAEIATHHVVTEHGPDGELVVSGLPDSDGSASEAIVALCDPYSFSAEALLEQLNAARPGVPVLGGLASAAAAGSASLFRDGQVLDSGAVACSIGGLTILPCVSQGATAVGPEMTITAASGNVIETLASVPAVERLREAIGELSEREQQLAARGLLLGIVIDPNRPEYRRGDFLVRPIIGADEQRGTLAIGERVSVGQTVRMHVRDAAAADEDLRDALRAQVLALGREGVAGALLFTCNGRGSHMFEVPDHDASTVEDALGAPAGGFFCAGEIGPVGGRNFLHGFTATLAVFGR